MDNVIYELLVPTISFGALGATVGAVLAVSKARPIPRYAVSTGLNFTILGGCFTGLRKLGQVAPILDEETKRTKLGRVWISAVSGAVTGSVFNAFVRGSRGLTMALLFYGGGAGVGEFAYQSILSPPQRRKQQTDSAAAPSANVSESEKSVWRKLKESSPLRPLSNQEFEGLMTQKIQSLDEQIQVVDEEIQRTKERMSTS